MRVSNLCVILSLSLFVSGCGSLQPIPEAKNSPQIPVMKACDPLSSKIKRVHIAVIPEDKKVVLMNARYFITVGTTKSVISSALVKGYSIFLENDDIGLSGAAKLVREDIIKYGPKGLQIDAYGNLGASTVINAMRSLLRDKQNIGRFGKTQIVYYDTTYQKENADLMLSKLQGRDFVDESQKNVMQLKVVIFDDLRKCGYIK